MREHIPFRIAARAGLIGKAQAAGCLVKPLLVWDFYFFQLAKQIENAYHSIWILPLGCICWKREPVLARKGFLLFYYNPVCKEKKACSKSRHTLITLWIHLFLLFAFFLSSLSFIKCCSTRNRRYLCRVILCIRASLWICAPFSPSRAVWTVPTAQVEIFSWGYFLSYQRRMIIYSLSKYMYTMIREKYISTLKSLMPAFHKIKCLSS